MKFLDALLLKATIWRAFKIACVVGAILIFINQGDLILSGDWPPAWKVILTFMVPYSVSSYSSAAFVTELFRKNPNASIEGIS